MSTSKITTIGLENYLNMENRSLFDNLNLPEGINKRDLEDVILLAAGDFEVLYPDPDYYRDAIALWGRKNYWTFDKWIKAINIQYDPLNNYDRTEEWTDEHEGFDVRNRESRYSSTGSSDTNESSQTNMGSESSSETKYGKKTTSELEVASYDSSSYQPREKSTNQDSGTDSYSDRSSSGSNTEGSSHINNNDSGNSSEDASGQDHATNTHHGRMYGNIGVTTSQQMLESELEIAKFNIYDQIADLFISEFCLMVY